MVKKWDACDREVNSICTLVRTFHRPVRSLLGPAAWTVERTTIMTIEDQTTWPTWLTCEECALILRLSLSTIRTLTQSQKLRSRKFGKRVRVLKSELLRFTNER